MRRLYTVLCLLVILAATAPTVTAHTQDAQSTPSLKTWTTEPLGFAVDYPSSWYARQAVYAGQDVQLDFGTDKNTLISQIDNKVFDGTVVDMLFLGTEKKLFTPEDFLQNGTDYFGGANPVIGPLETVQTSLGPLPSYTLVIQGELYIRRFLLSWRDGNVTLNFFQINQFAPQSVQDSAFAIFKSLRYVAPVSATTYTYRSEIAGLTFDYPQTLFGMVENSEYVRLQSKTADIVMYLYVELADPTITGQSIINDLVSNPQNDTVADSTAVTMDSDGIAILENVQNSSIYKNTGQRILARTIQKRAAVLVYAKNDTPLADVLAIVKSVRLSADFGTGANANAPDLNSVITVSTVLGATFEDTTSSFSFDYPAAPGWFITRQLPASMIAAYVKQGLTPPNNPFGVGAVHVNYLLPDSSEQSSGPKFLDVLVQLPNPIMSLFGSQVQSSAEINRSQEQLFETVIAGLATNITAAHAIKINGVDATLIDGTFMSGLPFTYISMLAQGDEAGQYIRVLSYNAPRDLVFAIALSVRHTGQPSQYHPAPLPVTLTPSISPTPSLTFTPTETYTPSLTYTPSETPSITPTPTITLTPSMTPTPSATLTPTMTPIPSQTPTPSITPTIDLTEIALLASPTPAPRVTTLTVTLPDNEDQVVSSDTIWVLFGGTRTLQRPGTLQLNSPLFGSRPLMMRYSWCAKTEAQEQAALAPFSLRFFVDEVEVAPSSILTFDRVSAQKQYCRFYATLLSDWPLGGKVVLKIVYTLVAPVFDGVSTFPAGVYTTELIMHPKGAPAPSTIAVGGVTTCPGSPKPRLVIGGQGRVTPGDPNNINTKPSRPSKDATSHKIGSIPAGGVFKVLDGPVCNQGITWWQVDYEGTVGWTGESDSHYWVEPVGNGN